MDVPMALPRARVRRAALVSVVALVTFSALWCRNHHVSDRQYVNDRASSEDIDWYTPIENDFRQEYERDTANQKFQTWNQYWSWVTTFYNGTKLYPGWSSQTRSTIGMVQSKQKQDELIKLLNELGKQISMEWAKDRAAGRISTADLIRWSPTIGAARRAEDGSGERSKEAVLKVQAEVARKLGLPPPQSTPER
jgi:hypothetical protein